MAQPCTVNTGVCNKSTVWFRLLRLVHKTLQKAHKNKKTTGLSYLAPNITSCDANVCIQMLANLPQFSNSQGVSWVLSMASDCRVGDSVDNLSVERSKSPTENSKSLYVIHSSTSISPSLSPSLHFYLSNMSLSPAAPEPIRIWDVVSVSGRTSQTGHHSMD